MMKDEKTYTGPPCPAAGAGIWSFVIEYLQRSSSPGNGRQPRVDYKEVLAAEDFAVFLSLRDLWPNIAEEEGVPVYTVFTNEQPAEIVRWQSSRLD